MQLHSFRYSCNAIVSFIIILLSRTKFAACNPITNSNLSEHIREFASEVDNINSTNVKTLQKEDPKRYSDIVSFKPLIFKLSAPFSLRAVGVPTHIYMALDVPDSKLSSTSYGRGLVSREHPGYALHDYEEYPHVNYGYDYHLPESHHHGYDHHVPDAHHHGYDHHNHQFGHHEINYLGHHKHYNHALAAKAVLWPIAGIALLGAAAALVSNPILLQLGVASGKRRRRNTEEISGPELSEEITEWRPHLKRHVAPTTTGSTRGKSTKTKLLKETANKNVFSSTQRIPYEKRPTTVSSTSYSPLHEESDEVNFVPVPIKTKYD